VLTRCAIEMTAVAVAPPQIADLWTEVQTQRVVLIFLSTAAPRRSVQAVPCIVHWSIRAGLPLIMRIPHNVLIHSRRTCTVPRYPRHLLYTGTLRVCVRMRVNRLWLGHGAIRNRMNRGLRWVGVKARDGRSGERDLGDGSE
jgi:hypothetical protein